MKKVITYGTYDLLHYGHIRLLERAKALGDYLIVGVTADDFDKTRGKINVQQSLMERVEAVKATGIADEIIVEEYEGQKIDDVRRYNVDVFSVGSDWAGKFDYLKEYCEVVYLERTEGVSSSNIRSEKREIRIGFAGKGKVLEKYKRECSYVNGIRVMGIYTNNQDTILKSKNEGVTVFDSYDDLLHSTDAVYIIEPPRLQYMYIKQAIAAGKHVLCESPLGVNSKEYRSLAAMAKAKNVILMDAIKTAYSTAYNRLQLLAQMGKIGKIVSVDTTCTSIRDEVSEEEMAYEWNSICTWGPTAFLPVFQLLGTEYQVCQICSSFADKNGKYDIFSKINFIYDSAVATAKVGSGVKSEGELVVSGTKGYIYVPAPWWKTDYFEIRYENPAENQRYFYQLDGEGIRYELVAFVKAIESGKNTSYVSSDISEEITRVIGKFESGDLIKIEM